MRQIFPTWLTLLLIVFGILSATGQGVEREQLILVVGGSATDSDWQDRMEIAEDVILTAQFRGIADSNLLVLATDSVAGIAPLGDPTAMGLQMAVALAQPATDHLNLVLITESDSGTNRLNASETISPKQLDLLLDVYQATGNSAFALLESSGSGIYLDPCLPTGNQKRIVMTATGIDRIRNPVPDVSFTTTFMRELRFDLSFISAFQLASEFTTLLSAGFHQIPEMRSSSLFSINSRLISRIPFPDGALGKSELPFINWKIDPVTAATISVANVSTKITGIRFFIPEPERFDPSEFTEIILSQDTNGTWSAPVGPLPFGPYPVTLFFQSESGWTPGQQANLSAAPPAVDIPTDRETIDRLQISPQNIPQVVDLMGTYGAPVINETWVRFFLTSDSNLGPSRYDILIDPKSRTMDIAMDLYVIEESGPRKVATANQYAAGGRESFQLTQPQDGFYLLRIYRILGLANEDDNFVTLTTRIPEDWNGIQVFSQSWQDNMRQVIPITARLTTLGTTDPPIETTFDQRGFFFVPPGSYELEVEIQYNHGSRIIASQYDNPVMVTAGDFIGSRALASFIFERGKTSVSVLARDSATGEGIPGADVRVRALEPKVVEGSVKTSEDGRGFFDIWSQSEHEITVRSPGYLPETQRVVGDFNDTLKTTFNLQSDGIPDTWKDLYFPGHRSSTVDVWFDDDPDEDGKTNLEEYQSGTNPVDENDVLKVELADIDNQMELRWIAREGISYEIQRRSSLTEGDWTLEQSFPAQSSERILQHKPGSTRDAFYRVEASR